MFPSMRFLRIPFVGLWLAALGIAVFPPPGTTAVAADVDAEARAILTANCQRCHGPTKQKGGLRFDSRDGLLSKGDSGSSAVTPGKPATSEMIRRVIATDAAVRMPPGEMGLTTAQIDTLRKWIEAGAAWPQEGTGPAPVRRTELTVTDDDRRHWAFRPLASVEPPAVVGIGKGRNVIDRFILAGLVAKRLTPA